MTLSLHRERQTWYISKSCHLIELNRRELPDILYVGRQVDLTCFYRCANTTAKLAKCMCVKFPVNKLHLKMSFTKWLKFFAGHSQNVLIPCIMNRTIFQIHVMITVNMWRQVYKVVYMFHSMPDTLFLDSTELKSKIFGMMIDKWMSHGIWQRSIPIFSINENPLIGACLLNTTWIYSIYFIQSSSESRDHSGYWLS